MKTTMPKINWTALVGKFEIKSGVIIIKGGIIQYDETHPGPMLANLKCDQYFDEGTITADIEFKKIEDSPACEIILNYTNNNKNFLVAGLGGAGWMYSIRSFDPSNTWTTYASAGDRNNLEENKTYHVKVTLKGSNISLFVNEINVLNTTLPFVLPQSQVGIWSLSKNDIFVKNYTVDTKPPKAFVIMEFNTPYDELYKTVIKPICKGTTPFLEVVREDERHIPGIVVSDIKKQIDESKIIIAEITPTNANVFYEVGYAHAKNKPTILIAKRGTRLPFDLASYRTLFYEDTISGKEKIEKGLKRFLEEILQQK